MKMIKTLMAAATLAIAAPVMAADYLPVGPQSDIALSTVTGGGWTLCYSAAMATPFGISAGETLSGCNGSRLMMAGRLTGSATLLLLAQTTKVDALNPTGAANNGVYTTSNGADWFYNDNYSWGFKPVGAGYSKSECGSGPSSMCIHVLDFTGGYSIGDISGLNGSLDYEKLVFTNAAAVPEAASWMMLIAGFGLVGAVQRRRQAVAA
jgi:hypothetical protein